MAENVPDRAEVVIIGGGVAGCSVAYHLTKIGWDDVVLLERKQLTSGTTWHAAGLVGQLRPSINMTKLAKYTGELYRGLEAETGQATGFRQTGSIAIATSLPPWHIAVLLSWRSDGPISQISYDCWWCLLFPADAPACDCWRDNSSTMWIHYRSH